MKIAISTDGDKVSSHFGRCDKYTIFETVDKKISAKTEVDTPPHQPGLLPVFLNKYGVNTVISGGMGPRARNLFLGMNIQPIVGVRGKIGDVIAAFLDGTLEQGESLCTHGEGGHSGQCGHSD